MNSSRSIARLVLLASLLAATGCKESQSVAVQISPATITVAPGRTVQFTVTSPPAAAVTWSVDPPTAGTINGAGLFTATASPSTTTTIATIVATLLADPSKIGMAVVTIEIPPVPYALPMNIVAASGGQQSGAGMQVETIVQEPVSAATSRSASGTIEIRSGFFPAGSPSSP